VTNNFFNPENEMITEKKFLTKISAQNKISLQVDLSEE
jgi:hypothetical protein